jgi:lipopolysaccharide/colanic/teichoic acid biosynthesis glycosyltransferase
MREAEYSSNVEPGGEVTTLEEPTSNSMLENVGQLSEPRPNGDGRALAGLLRGPRNRPGATISVEGLPDRRVLATFAKRTFDLVAATLLLLLAVPFLLAVAIAIRLDSPGPVLFRQKRVGRGGEVFSMFKFRTMVRDADALKHRLVHLNEAGDGLFKIDGDPRQTRVGAFLRSTSLDEIPQLLHVLTGRMSLVGPRPLVPEEDIRIDGGHRRRLEVRPGLTGPWQIAGERIPLQEMVEIDTGYVDTWTLGGDLRLILRTVLFVLGRRGL